MGREGTQQFTKQPSCSVIPLSTGMCRRKCLQNSLVGKAPKPVWQNWHTWMPLRGLQHTQSMGKGLKSVCGYGITISLGSCRNGGTPHMAGVLQQRDPGSLGRIFGKVGWACCLLCEREAGMHGALPWDSSGVT